MQNNEKYAKYVRKLVAVQAFGDFCVLATKVCEHLRVVDQRMVSRDRAFSRHRKPKSDISIIR